jgi:hypothetical protein
MEDDDPAPPQPWLPLPLPPAPPCAPKLADWLSDTPRGMSPLKRLWLWLSSAPSDAEEAPMVKTNLLEATCVTCIMPEDPPADTDPCRLSVASMEPLRSAGWAPGRDEEEEDACSSRMRLKSPAP